MTPTARPDPCRVFLSSGHMLDRADRAAPRFPPRCEPRAAEAIARALDDAGATAGDTAVSGAACGGDLLFAEAALARGLRWHAVLPFAPGRFAADSVDFAGPAWRARFDAALARADATVVLPEAEAAGNPYERANLAMLERAVAASDDGGGRLTVVVLWDGGGGDGPGGTAHMVAAAEKAGARVVRLDPRRLCAGAGPGGDARDGAAPG